MVLILILGRKGIRRGGAGREGAGAGLHGAWPPHCSTRWNNCSTLFPLGWNHSARNCAHAPCHACTMHAWCMVHGAWCIRPIIRPRWTLAPGTPPQPAGPRGGRLAGPRATVAPVAPTRYLPLLIPISSPPQLDPPSPPSPRLISIHPPNHRVSIPEKRGELPHSGRPGPRLLPPPGPGEKTWSAGHLPPPRGGARFSVSRGGGGGREGGGAQGKACGRARFFFFRWGTRSRQP